MTKRLPRRQQHVASKLNQNIQYHEDKQKDIDEEHAFIRNALPEQYANMMYTFVSDYRLTWKKQTFVMDVGLGRIHKIYDTFYFLLSAVNTDNVMVYIGLYEFDQLKFIALLNQDAFYDLDQDMFDVESFFNPEGKEEDRPILFLRNDKELLDDLNRDGFNLLLYPFAEKNHFLASISKNKVLAPTPAVAPAAENIQSKTKRKVKVKKPEVGDVGPPPPKIIQTKTKVAVPKSQRQTTIAQTLFPPKRESMSTNKEFWDVVDQLDENILVAPDLHINVYSLKKLKPKTWLNDTVIDSFLLYTFQKTPITDALPITILFATKLISDGMEDAQIYTRRYPLFSFKRLFIPINLDNTHWVFVMVDLVQREIVYYDSMGGNANAAFTIKIMGLISQWLQLEAVERREINFIVNAWKQVVMEKGTIPLQKDGYNCGLYVIKNILHLATEPPRDKTKFNSLDETSYTIKDIDELRLIMLNAFTANWNPLVALKTPVSDSADDSGEIGEDNVLRTKRSIRTNAEKPVNKRVRRETEDVNVFFTDEKTDPPFWQNLQACDNKDHGILWGASVNNFLELKNNDWLDQSIIDAYMFLLSKEPGVSPRTKYMSPDVFAKYEDSDLNFLNEDNQELSTEFQDVDTFIIPFNSQRSHWVLIVVSVPNKTIDLYDSLRRSSDRSRHNTQVFDWYSTAVNPDAVENEWTLTNVPHDKCPQQANAYDCGVFTLMGAKILTQGGAIHAASYTQESMRQYRDHITNSIRRRSLDETVVPWDGVCGAHNLLYSQFNNRKENVVVTQLVDRT